jgi:beta-phosphoglucomutase
VTTALQGIIFDFDGVIADSEPLHFRAFQQTLSEDGLELSPKEYYARYLGYDDVGMFQAIGEDRGVPMDGARVAGLVTRKGQKLQAMLTTGAVLFPGAVDFIRSAAGVVPIAIASGALRHEIDEVVLAAGVAGLFSTIVASGDTPESKPSPAPYRLAFDRLREASGTPLDPARCVAIEDSRWGLESALGAGLRCVAVTNSYPADELTGAELVVSGLKDLTLDALDRLCAGALPK